MSRKKRITIEDMFYHYPYKKNIQSASNTIPQPYIKKKDVIDDNPNSLDYNEWSAIVEDYIDIINDVLLSGREYMFPNYLGKLQLRKYKTYRLIDYAESKKYGKKIYYKGSDSLRIILKWYRDYNIARFRYRFHWKIRMATKLSKAIYNKTKLNPNYVYNILDI